MFTPPLLYRDLHMSKITLGQLEDAIEAHKDFKEKFLHQRGWENTCGIVPGIWLWRKEVDGQQLTSTNVDGAIHIERYSFNG